MPFAHVGAEFATAATLLLFNSFLLTRVTILLQKLSKAIVKEIRIWKLVKEKEDIHDFGVAYPWHADPLFFIDAEVKSINWWSASEERELTKHEGLRPAKPQSTWSLNVRFLLSAAKMTFMCSLYVWGNERKLIATVISSG